MESKLNPFFIAKRVPKTFHFGGFGDPFRGKSGHFCHFLFKWAPDLQKVPREVPKVPQIGGFWSQFGTQNSNLWSFWDLPRHFLRIYGPLGTSRGTFWSSGVFKWPKNHPKNVDFCYFCEKIRTFLFFWFLV